MFHVPPCAESVFRRFGRWYVDCARIVKTLMAFTSVVASNHVERDYDVLRQICDELFGCVSSLW